MLTRMHARAAVQDLKNRTLAPLHGDIARLVYLSATRDYNSGKYYHDGLALRFTEEIANQALAQCHAESFQKVAEIPLRELVGQLQEYLESVCADEAIQTWLDLEPYRMLMPLTCDPLSAKLFCSNVMIALTILESRAKKQRKN